MNGSKHLPYKAFLPYLDDGGKLYFTILPSDTLTVDGTLIFISHTISYNISKIYALCDILQDEKCKVFYTANICNFIHLYAYMW